MKMSVRVALLVTAVVVLCQLPTTVFSACEVNCADALCDRYPGGCGTACKNGYGINTTAHRCQSCSSKCNSSIGACNSCGPGKCDRYCNSGYSVVNCDCVLCATNCLNCSVNGYLKCNSGYCAKGYAYDSTYSVCSPCDANCSPAVGCSQPATCNAGGCKDPGYAQVPLSAGSTVYTCNPCDVNCNGSCKVKGADKCDSLCKVGYSLNTTTNTCYSCSPHCTSGCATEGPGFCDTTCETGYACSPAAGDPTKHACYPCATHCTSGCSVKGCCGTSTAPATCDVGTPVASSTDSTCTICS